MTNETGKAEIRSTKFETNSNAPNFNDQNGIKRLFWILNICILILFRISDFGFRYSNLSPSVLQLVFKLR